MKDYFGIKWEFDTKMVDDIIQYHIDKNIPGYVCSLDMNNFRTAMQNPAHLLVLNSSIVNNCDSSWIPSLINKIHKTKYKNYCGTDLFFEYIKKRRYVQFFLGSTQEILDGLKNELSKIDPEIKNMRFETLPFRNVEDFDYESIAKIINQYSPDIIWVSLGAPKQEQFMYRLKPYLNRGVMFGFGAIFKVFCGLPEFSGRAPKWLVNLKLEFLYRILTEPNQLVRKKKSLPFVRNKYFKEQINFEKRKNNYNLQQLANLNLFIITFLFTDLFMHCLSKIYPKKNTKDLHLS